MALRTQSGAVNGLSITPSSAFDTAHAATAKLLIAGWVYLDALVDLDGLIGRAIRANGANGQGHSLNCHYLSGDPSGHIWALHSTGSANMGTSHFGNFTQATWLVAGEWQLLAQYWQLDLTPRNETCRLSRNGAAFSTGLMNATPDSTFVNMTNGPVEIGTQLGWNAPANNRTEKWFREIGWWIDPVDADAIVAYMWNGGNAAPVAGAPEAPDLGVSLGADLSEINGFTTAAIGSGAIEDCSALGGPFAP